MVERKEQILMVGGGLMVAFGFMFMGAASLSGLTTDAGSGNQGEPIDAELPNNTYSQTSFGLGPNEQALLAYENEVVFVNAIYDNETDFSYLEGLDEQFNGRVYVNYVRQNETRFTSTYQINEYPSIIVVGDQQTQQGPYINRAENNRESVVSTVCNGMRNVGDAAAICF